MYINTEIILNVIHLIFLQKRDQYDRYIKAKVMAPNRNVYIKLCFVQCVHRYVGLWFSMICVLGQKKILFGCTPPTDPMFEAFPKYF